ncbi:MAG: GntR family transcriptional regulator, partial [Bacillota bacterium]
ATEGLVSILPRRGTFASELIFSDVQDLLELRWHLEAVAARLAASRITEEELKAIERLFEGVNRLPPGSPDHVRIDTEFHRILQQATRNRYLADTLARLHTLSLRLMFVTRAKAAELPDALGQYLAVVEALRRRDPEATERAVHAHLDDFRERLRASL